MKPSDPTPYVGRSELLASLREAAEALRAGQGGLILLVGEPGIGKTRTATELARTSVDLGLAVVWARCHEGEGAPALWPWTQVLRGLIGGEAEADRRAALGSEAEAIAPLLPELGETSPAQPAAQPLSEPEARFRLFDAVARVLARAGSERPLLVILDDLQWADSATLRLLAFLAREHGDAPLLVLGTVRESEGEPADVAAALADLPRAARTCSLTGLPETDVERYVELATQARAAPATVARLHELSGGNPFFLGEFVTLLAAHPAFERGRGIDALPAQLPRSVQHAVERRLEAIAPPERLVLAAAAACGPVFDVALLAQVAEGVDRAGVEDALAEAVRARLAVADDEAPGRYRFGHALIRETLYRSLPGSERVALHRRAADALTARHPDPTGDALTAIAHHLAEAGAGGDPAQAVRANALAAEQALRLLAYDDANARYGVAIALLEQQGAAGDRERCALLIARARVQALADLRDDNTATARDAAELARRLGDPPLLAQAALSFQLQLSGIAISDQQVDAGRIALLEEAASVLGDRDDALRSQVLAALSVLTIYAEPLARRTEQSDEALRIARASGDQAVLQQVLATRAWALWTPENAPARRDLADEMAALAEVRGSDPDQVAALVVRIAANMELGDRPAVERDIERYAQVAERSRLPGAAWSVAMYRAMTTTLDGHYAEAEERVNEAFALGQRTQNPNALQAFGVQLNRIRREQDRIDEVVQLIGIFAAQFPEQWAWQCAGVYFRAERGEDVRDEIRALLARDPDDLPRDSLWLVALGILAELCVLQGDRAAAAGLYERLLPCAGRNIMVAGATANFGPVSRCLAGLALLLDHWEEALRHFDDALDTCTGTGDRSWYAHTLRNLASALVARGDPVHLDWARSVVARARERFEALGTPHFAERLPPIEPPSARPEAPSALARAAVERNGLERRGPVWVARFEGITIHLRDSKGLRYVARLVSEPDREIHVSDLVAGESGAATPSRAEADAAAGGAAGGESGLEVLDEQARRAYRDRITDLREELEEAEGFADTGRAERAREELEQLEQALGAAIGLGGRTRRVSDPVERARKAVYGAIRFSLRRIEQEHPALGRHWARSIETGTYCVYRPDAPAEWDVSR